jgi:hypothetical protein
MALPNSKDGKDQALTSTDKFTKRVGIIPGKATWSAEEWGVALVRHWQLTDWGFPRVIISDRDRKFLSNLWKGVFKTLRTKLLYSTAYHVQTDGQSERTNATIEIMLRYFLAIIYSMTNDFGSESPFIVDDWPSCLPLLHAILNSSPNATTGRSPHEIMYGMTLGDPLRHLSSVPETPALQDFTLRDDAYEALKLAAVYIKDRYDRAHTEKHFRVGDRVYLTLHKRYPGYADSRT